MDLCRDAALIERDWRCVMPLCGQPYNREWVENALLQIVRKRERLYHLQDLLCVKCRQVRDPSNSAPFAPVYVSSHYRTPAIAIPAPSPGKLQPIWSLGRPAATVYEKSTFCGNVELSSHMRENG